MEMKTVRICIGAVGIAPKGRHAVEIDGHHIQGVRAVKFETSVNQATVITLELVGYGVELDGEVDSARIETTSAEPIGRSRSFAPLPPLHD